MSGLDRRPLGDTEVSVSSLCLGTMMFGDQIGEEAAFRQMDRCFDFGIDFFDTAEIYTIPPKAETQGDSERIVGKWMKERGCRDKIVLATKVSGRSGNQWLRGTKEKRVTPAQIREAVEDSLERLQTDYIDLYQIHWPDRRVAMFGSEPNGFVAQDNADAVPIAEQLGGMAELVREGKIRYVGLSNETAWGVMEFVRAAEREGLPRVVSIQNAYSLVNRTFEQALAEVAMEEKVGLLAYSPIAQGSLSGKYLGGQKPKGSRGEMFGRLDRYKTPNAEAAIAAYVEVARDMGVHPAALAMQFVTTRPFVTSNIFGANGDEQLDVIFNSLEVELTTEVMQRITDIHKRYTNPCP
ncbi:aldo/keto reductase [Parvularcula marina]|uniref:Aldo/keto reductase n=1 Tax=Parvularcula marina TaxID=2292771 RepID=A0A371RK27_9PROT|nr:aldo/keto reductase [Parvularcula marina]RFB05801.1 aldo/keto reductase [Parvularcula marina]